MKYPFGLSSKIEEIEPIVSTWPDRKSIDDVIRWVLQLDRGDYDLAIRIIKNLTVIGHDDLGNALRVANSKLMRKSIEKGARVGGRNTLFAGLGAPGKSGAMISYHFRVTNDDISEENFLEEDTLDLIVSGDLKVENLVLIDDFIGTGTQATREITDIAEKVLPLGITNIYLLAVCGLKQGIEKIEAETKAFTFAAYEFDESDTCRNLNSPFYDGVPEAHRKALRDQIENYGRIASRRMPLGFEGIGGLVAFYYNVPNTTISLVWGEQNNWIPLFRRATRINGILDYYKMLEKAKEKTTAAAPQPGTTPQSTKEAVVFVEGKYDELFFDALKDKYDLPNKLGVTKVTVVALGQGMPLPASLREQIDARFPHYVIVADGENTPRTRPLFPDDKLILLSPNIMELVDIRVMMAELGSNSAELAAMDPESVEAKLHAEHLLKRRAITRNFVIREVVDRCTKPEAVEDLIGRMKAVLDAPHQKEAGES